MQGHGGDGVAEPLAAAFGELVEGVVDEVVGVVAAARRYGGDGLGHWVFSVVGAGGGDAAEVAVLEPVAVAFEADDVGVVDQAVDHGGGNGVVAEDLTPAAERLVAGDDDAGGLVAGGDELEEQVGGLGLERDVAHFVDDDEGVASQAGDLGLEAAGAVGGGELVGPGGGGGEQDAVPGLAGFDPESCGEHGLAGSRGAEQHDVGLGGDEVEGGQVQDVVASDGALVVEVEVLELSGVVQGPSVTSAIVGQDACLTRRRVIA